MDKLIGVATENTVNFVFATKPGLQNPVIIEDVTHLLNVALFDAIAEIFRKHYTKDQADFYMKSIFIFYNAGWTSLLSQEF
jgi:hypothetical protein